MSPRSSENHYDVIIVGAGPAGLEAALVLCRQQRRVLVVDSMEYRNAASQGAHMLIGQDGIPPQEIREKALATRSRMILACGVRDNCDSIEGLRAAFGRTCFHCPYCHGHERAGQDIVVFTIPGTPASKSAYQARYLKDRISPKVRLIAPLEELDQDLRRMIEAAQIPVIDDRVVKVSDPGKPLELSTEQGAVIPCESGFVAPPMSPTAQTLIDSLGLETSTGLVLVDGNCRTSVPQVFAAGDVAVTSTQDKPLTFVGQAIGQGQQAAVEADQDLFMTAIESSIAPSRTHASSFTAKA